MKYMSEQQNTTEEYTTNKIKETTTTKNVCVEFHENTTRWWSHSNFDELFQLNVIGLK